MNRHHKPKVSKLLRMMAALAAGKFDDAYTTDFNFCDDQNINMQMFYENFTMQANTSDIALQAGLLGYNDNLN